MANSSNLSKRFHVRLSEESAKKVRDYVSRNGVSLGSLFEEALNIFFSRDKLSTRDAALLKALKTQSSELCAVQEHLDILSALFLEKAKMDFGLIPPVLYADDAGQGVKRQPPTKADMKALKQSRVERFERSVQQHLTQERSVSSSIGLRFDAKEGDFKKL